ncbi:hypothetical protein QGM71_21055 [Virgibacillus sp. C22-A2]|uniref:Acyltransferase family protein n=2 Tax=Virgibacillus tibetensis TaxID=3042313 RepID=A0ABU6KMY2_9BACI|nr:hypothetical protein [Virgibacillus sp. C22-A2]
MTIPLIFVLLLAIMKHNNLGKNTFVSKIGANAVGIYVSHVFVMEVIRIIMTRVDLAHVQDTLIWKVTFTPAVFILAYILYGQKSKQKQILGLYLNAKFSQTSRKSPENIHNYLGRKQNGKNTPESFPIPFYA